MILRHIPAVLTVLLAILATSCGRGPDGDTWLFSLTGDTITVAEGGEAWSCLSLENQNSFLSKSNHIGEFIISMARKALIVNEIQRLEYLSGYSMKPLGDAWLSVNAAFRGRDYIMSVTEASITESDIEFYMDHMGKTVWFTSAPGTPDEYSKGPAHLPELQQALAMHIDSMSTGDELEYSDGTVIRLDSVFVTDPALVQETLRDSVRVSSYARQKLLSSRGSENLSCITDSVLALATPDIRYHAIHRLAAYYSGQSELIPEDTVVVSGLGVLTSGDFIHYIQYQSTLVPVQPSDTIWLSYFIDLSLSRAAIFSYLSSVAPEIAEEMTLEKDSWLLGVASEHLYADMVSSAVEVSPEAVREEFDNLNDVPTIPETRSVQCVRISAEQIDEYRDALISGDEDINSIITRFGFFPELSRTDPPSSFTRPLLPEEVPGYLGEVVFSLNRADTVAWSDPSPLVEDQVFTAFRLVKVHPSHEATFDEIRDELELIVRTRLEEEQTNQWLLDLEERYGLEINEGILSSLPADPALWKDL